MLSVARPSIRRLDVSRGKPSRGASAFERAFAGAIVGAISVALDNDPDGKRWPHYFPTERWRRIRLGN